MSYACRAKHYAKNNLHQRILYNAVERGVGLTNVPAERNRRWSIYPTEDLIIKILKYGEEPRLIYGIPIILYKNKVSYEKLANEAVKCCLANEMGYILQMTHRLFKEHNGHKIPDGLEHALAILKSNRDDNEHIILRASTAPNIEEVLKTAQLPEEKLWNVLGRFTYEGFAHAYSCCQ